MYASIQWEDNGVYIIVKSEKIFFKFNGVDFLNQNDASFAVWALLPIAMLRRDDIYIDANVDPIVLENAMAVSRIWEMWVPERFSSVNVQASSSQPFKPEIPSSEVQLFSGGVDSTYTLLIEAPSHVLTVRGLDYSYETEQFSGLVAKTKPLLSSVGAKQIVVSTNIYDLARPADLTHGFALAACVFLLQGQFSGSILAADYTPAQDMVSFPWGTNHVTNDYFSGTSFRMRTSSSSKSRIEKLAYLADHPIACSSLSFCGNKKYRPENCGVCAKCVRTKAMFMAATGAVPSIFVHQPLTGEQIRGVDLSKRKDYAFFADIYGWASSHGRLALIPDLEEVIANYKRRVKNQRSRNKALHQVRKLLRMA